MSKNFIEIFLNAKSIKACNFVYEHYWHVLKQAGNLQNRFVSQVSYKTIN